MFRRDFRPRPCFEQDLLFGQPIFVTIVFGFEPFIFNIATRICASRLAASASRLDVYSISWVSMTFR